MKYTLKSKPMGRTRRSVLMVIALVTALSAPIGAANASTTTPESSDQLQVTARVTNLETGEIEEVPTNIADDGAGVAEVQVLKPQTKLPGVATPAISVSQSVQKSITAKGTITYNKLGSKIRVSNFKGSWSAPSSGYTISNRFIGGNASSQLDAAHTLKKYPSSNSFSYNTGWGYTDYVSAQDFGGARMFMSADYSYSGMAKMQIELEVKVP